jgi:hypothetical protein
VTPRDLEAVPLHPPEIGAFIEFRIHDRDVAGRGRLEEGIVAQTPPLVEPLGITEEAAEVNGPTGPPAVEIQRYKVTVRPRCTFVPGCGSCLMTLPSTGAGFGVSMTVWTFRRR